MNVFTNYYCSYAVYYIRITNHGITTKYDIEIIHISHYNCVENLSNMSTMVKLYIL